MEWTHDCHTGTMRLDHPECSDCGKTNQETTGGGRMSEWDCEHGVSDDAQTPCPLCAEARRIDAKIEAMDLYNYPVAEMRTALQRIAELESAMRRDISDAKANCNTERCQAYFFYRGKKCPDCPLDWLGSCREVLEKGE